MTVETQYNVVKVNELREITVAQGVDQLIINDLDSSPLETKKITAENLALSIKDYILPIAGEGNDGELGGVKIGDGLTINPITGVLSNDIVSLSDLDDVIILNPEANHVLRYNGVQWVNQSEGGFTNIIAGDGLSGGGTEGEIILNVNAGIGLSINNDLLTFNAGKGLGFTGDYVDVQVAPGLTITGNQVALVPGNGIVVQDQSVQVNPGKGLKFVGSRLTADIGRGLIFSGNTLEVEQSLVDLTDVIINSPTEAQGLVFSSNQWVNKTISSDWTETDPTSPRFIHNKPNFTAVNGNLGPNGTMSITVDTSPEYCPTQRLIIRAEAKPVNAAGEPIVGIFEFTWQVSSNNGLSWTDYSLTRETDITYSRENQLVISQHNPTDIYRLVVRFEDLYANEVSAISQLVIPVAGTTASVTNQPLALDLSTDTSGTMSVDVSAPNPEYFWFINGILITGSNNPDVGYTFSNFNTAQLLINRTAPDAKSYTIHAEIKNGSVCNSTLISDSATLTGPDTVIEVPPSIPGPGEIGSYTLTEPFIVGNAVGLNWGVGSVFQYGGGTYRVMGSLVHPECNFDDCYDSGTNVVLIMRIA